MQITIDTEVDSFESAVDALRAAFGAPPPAPITEPDSSSASEVSDSAVIIGGWNAKKLRKWARWLRDDAAEVVRYVAANAPEVRYDDVAEHLGQVKNLPGPVDGKSLGGAMSSGGHAANGISGVQGQPIARDHGRRMYVIDERVAAVLADELGPPDS